MIQRQTEAIVLRTWPFHEADLLVSVFTREYGKVKGVARSAMKSRKRFGGALEPMTHVRAQYAERPKQELVRLDSFEIVSSPLSQPVDYARAAALEFLSEVLEQALPEHGPEDAVFRLTLSVLDEMRGGRVWMPLTYFMLWVTRLMGWMPDLQLCAVCGISLRGGAGYFSTVNDGLTCAEHRHPASMALPAESLAMAESIFRRPVRELAGEAWPRGRGVELRRFATEALERHLEHKLMSARALAKM